MSQPLLALAFQEAAPDNSMWIIIGVVLVVLVFIVVIIGVGLTIFFMSRKRSKAQISGAAAAMTSGSLAPSLPDASSSASQPLTPDAPYPIESSGVNQSDAAALAEGPSDLLEEEADPDFDPSRTVAINREPTVAISFGAIKFVSGVLAGQEFEVVPEGAFIGRDSSVSQIVVNDPRISKRHLWIGVRDGVVMIADQASRNGTFLNDPQSERITESKLSSGDTVIMGESDVARFEYEA